VLEGSTNDSASLGPRQPREPQDRGARDRWQGGMDRETHVWWGGRSGSRDVAPGLGVLPSTVAETTLT